MRIESEEKLCFNAELHTYHNNVYTKYEKLSESEIKQRVCDRQQRKRRQPGNTERNKV